MKADILICDISLNTIVEEINTRQIHIYARCFKIKGHKIFKRWDSVLVFSPI